MAGPTQQLANSGARGFPEWVELSNHLKGGHLRYRITVIFKKRRSIATKRLGLYVLSVYNLYASLKLEWLLTIYVSRVAQCFYPPDSIRDFFLCHILRQEIIAIAHKGKFLYF